VIEVLLYVLLVRGGNMVDKAQVQAWVESANREYQPAGIRLVVKRIRTVPNPYPLFDVLGNQFEKYHGLRVLSTRRGWVRPRRWITSWVVHGLQGPEGAYSWGMATGTCYRRYPMIVSSGIRKNSRGEDRVYHGEVALTHEAGHIVGAGHTEILPATIMHPDALRYAGERLYFADESISQMVNCRWGK